MASKDFPIQRPQHRVHLSFLFLSISVEIWTTYFWPVLASSIRSTSQSTQIIPPTNTTINLVALTDIDLGATFSTIVFDVVRVHGMHQAGEFSLFLRKHLNNLISTIVLLVLIKIPFVGPVCLGLITFLSLNDKLGTVAFVDSVFVSLISVPNRYSALFLNTYWGSRSMIRDLLLPYFSSTFYQNRKKRSGSKSREGLLFWVWVLFLFGHPSSFLG